MNEAIQTATADVNGTKLFYRIAGDPQGPPVLLWHGSLNRSTVSFLITSGTGLARSKTGGPVVADGPSSAKETSEFLKMTTPGHHLLSHPS